MNILYLDPILGISGDMTISALIDAGCPFSVLDDLLRRLPLDLPSIEPEKKRKGAIEGTYLHIGHSHGHLAVSEMREMMANLDTEERVKKDALGILEVLVDAEAKAHGVPREEVHFHELSHVDTIIDVLCVARAVAYFDIDRVLSGPIPVGRGLIKTAHGIMPNPPPATTELLDGFDVAFLDEEKELTTPTGAAIVRYYVKSRAKIPFRVKSHGYGFGTFETEKPNVLRVFVGEAAAADAVANADASAAGAVDQEVWVIEADLDDMETEYLGAVAERMRASGALDVLYFPVQMKKGRPGVRLSIVTHAQSLRPLIDTVLRETTTFGLRFRQEYRCVLDRTEETRETSFGPVRVKTGFDKSGNKLKSHVEFEEVRRIADERGMAYRTLLDALKKEL
jgi:pyridinium-3,5-bisthiocarboxylic acid mononucleotide nickel chelatase